MAVNFSSTKSFMELHEDVMIEIFRHLDIKSLVCVALTCKKLKLVAYTPSLWKNCVVSLHTFELKKYVADSFNMRQIGIVFIKLDTAVVNVWNNIFIQRNLDRLASADCIKFLTINHLPRDDVLRTRPTLFFPTRFHSLTCLILKENIKEQEFLTYDYLCLLEAAFKALINLSQLQFEFVIAPTFHDRIPSAAFVEKFTKFKYFSLILKCLPLLEDLQIYEDYEHTYVRDELLPTDKRFSGEQEIRPNMKRFSISQAILDSHLEWMQIPKLFPNLKHLGIECNEPKNRVSESYIKGVLCQMGNLESIELSIERTDISDLIPKLPGLKALKLNPETSYSDFETLIESCPNLQVLSITSFVLATDHLCTAIKRLRNLQILKISEETMNSFDDKLFHSLQTCNTRLSSLIGVVCNNPSDLPPQIKFITCEADGYTRKNPVCLLMRNANDWVKIRKESTTWHEAMGTWFFHVIGGTDF